jgi:hypothetical protein
VPVSLDDYQFVIDTIPEVPFGVGHPIVVRTFEPAGFGVRNQDTEAPTGDAMLFGIDRHTPPVWSWEMYTGPTIRTTAAALDLVDRLHEVWSADDTRSQPSLVLPLRYAVAGRTRRVYCRPRRFAVVPDLIQHGRVQIIADAQLAEALSYDDLEESVTVWVSPAEITGTGFDFPVKFPLFTATVPDPQTGQAIIRGSAPTWVSLGIIGPVSNPWVQIGTLRYALSGSVAAGETITLSGRSWDHGVQSSSGAYKPQMLDPRARLSQLRFKPGQYPVTFGGFDPTGTSRVRVRWRNAYRGM